MTFKGWNMVGLIIHPVGTRMNMEAVFLKMFSDIAVHDFYLQISLCQLQFCDFERVNYLPCYSTVSIYVFCQSQFCVTSSVFCIPSGFSPCVSPASTAHSHQILVSPQVFVNPPLLVSLYILVSLIGRSALQMFSQCSSFACSSNFQGIFVSRVFGCFVSTFCLVNIHFCIPQAFLPAFWVLQLYSTLITTGQYL